MEPSSSLLVDLYELTMAAALHAEGRADSPAVFSLFVRQLPPTRGYLVAAGLDDALSYLERLRFTPSDLEHLARLATFDEAFLERLGELRFTGAVRAVPEGRLIFAGEPLLEVEGPLAACLLVETILLNQISLSTTLATKASRYRHAAAGRTLADFSLRRTHGVDAGMKVARSSAIAGFASTSNVAAAARWGLRASGTMAHSYVLAHADELDAFRAFARYRGGDVILLVDTYDTPLGVELALQVARELAAEGRRLRAVRLDSGDLASLSRRARTTLDRAGFEDVAILASGGLSELDVAALVDAGAPIDVFGVGTQLGVSGDAPALDSVYKLVEVDGRPVRKRSTGKETLPGGKQVWRRPGFGGDVIALVGEEPPEAGAEGLLEPVFADGRRRGPGLDGLEEAKARFEADWAALPEAHKHLESPGRYPVETSERLRMLARGLDLAGAAATDPVG